MLDFTNQRLTTTRSIGTSAESLAQQYLEHQGLSFIAKNYHCRRGEVDLIMEDKTTLIFIEVRYRKQVYYGQAFETISRKKQQKIIQTAKHYLHQHQLTESVSSRFDVIGITSSSSRGLKYQSDKNGYSFDWITNAFY